MRMISGSGEVAFEPSEVAKIEAAFGIAVEYWKDAKLHAKHVEGSSSHESLFEEQEENYKKLSYELSKIS